MPQTTRVLDAEWVEVTPEDGKVFYAHKPTNTTQWERPQLAAPAAAPVAPAAPDPAVQGMLGHFASTFGLPADDPSLGAAALRLVQRGCRRPEDFARVPTRQLGQLGLKRGHELKIRAVREQEEGEAARREPPRRSRRVGSIAVVVKGVDIGAAWTDAVVNAANSRSFTEGDAGVSGVLRDACSEVGPGFEASDVCGQQKTWLTETGEHTGAELPMAQAGLQPAGGRLKRSGVQWVVHAVGPEWTIYTPEQCTDPEGEHFKHITTLIRTTVERSLAVAASRGCKSIIIPAISGGIFTHQWGGPPGLAEAEQLAAREALVAAAVVWAQSEGGAGSSMREIVLVDHPDPRIGRCDLLERGFDTCAAEGWVPPQPQPPPTARETLMRTTGVFSATRAGELSVRKGEVLAAVPETREENGWWRMSRGEESGWVPAAVLEPCIASEAPAPAPEPEPAPPVARAGGFNRTSAGGPGLPRAESEPWPAGAAAGVLPRSASAAGPTSLTDRLEGYGIPRSQAAAYERNMAARAEELCEGGAPKTAMELFEECSLEGLRGVHGFKAGHLRRVEQMSPSHSRARGAV